MNLADLLADTQGVLVDRGASRRDNQSIPSEVIVKHVDVMPLSALIDVAMQSHEVPAVVIAESGRVVVLSAGASGIVWMQGVDENPSQTSALKLVYDAFAAMGVKVPKRRKKIAPAFVVDDEATVTVS